MSRRPTAGPPVGTPGGSVPSLAGLTINVPKTAAVEAPKRVRENENVVQAVLRDPSLKRDLESMAQAVRMYYPAGSTTKSEAIWETMYTLQASLSEPADEAVLRKYRASFQKIVFQTRSKPAKMLRGLSDAHPIHMLTNLLRSPLFAAMMQKEEDAIHSEVFQELVDTVKQGRKQFRDVMIACTASSASDGDQPGTVDRDVFFNAADYMMSTGLSWSVFIPQRMNVVNTIQKEIFDADNVPPPALREVFGSYLNICYMMLLETAKKQGGDAEDRKILEFLEDSSDLGTTGVRMAKSFTQKTTSLSLVRGVSRAFWDAFKELIEVRPAIEDGPAGSDDVKGNKEKLDSLAANEIDFSPWVTALSQANDISDDVDKRKEILYSGYVKMLIRVMMRKKGDMWFGTSALSVITFISLYDSMNWSPMEDAVKAEERNKTFKRVVEDEMKRVNDSRSVGPTPTPTPAPTPAPAPSSSESSGSSVAPMEEDTMTTSFTLPTAEQTIQVIVHSPDPVPQTESPRRETRSDTSQRSAAENAAASAVAEPSADVIVPMSEFAAHQLQNNSQTNTQAVAAQEITKALEEKIGKLEQALTTGQSEAEKNTIKIQKLTKTAAGLMNALKAKRAEVDAKINDLNQSNATVASRDKALEQSKARIAARDKLLDDLNEELNKAKSEYLKIIEELGEVEEKLAAESSLTNSLKESIDDLEEDHLDAMNTIRELENAKSQAQRTLELERAAAKLQQRNQKRELEDIQQRLKEATDKRQQKIADRDAAIAAKKQLQKDAAEAKESLEKQRNEHKQEMARIEADKKEALAETEALRKTRLAQIEANRKKAVDQKKNEDAEKAKTDKRRAELEAEIQKLEKKQAAELEKIKEKNRHAEEMKRARLEAKRIASEQRKAALEYRKKHGEVAFEAASATAHEADLLGKLCSATTSEEVQESCMQRLFGALNASTWTKAKAILKGLGKAALASRITGVGYFSSVAATLLWAMLPPPGKEGTMSKLRLWATELFTNTAKSLKLGCISALVGGAAMSVVWSVGSLAVQGLLMRMTPRVANLVYIAFENLMLAIRFSDSTLWLKQAFYNLSEGSVYDIIEAVILANTPASLQAVFAFVSRNMELLKFLALIGYVAWKNVEFFNRISLESRGKRIRLRYTPDSDRLVLPDGDAVLGVQDLEMGQAGEQPGEEEGEEEEEEEDNDEPFARMNVGYSMQNVRLALRVLQGRSSAPDCKIHIASLAVLLPAIAAA